MVRQSIAYKMPHRLTPPCLPAILTSPPHPVLKFYTKLPAFSYVFVYDSLSASSFFSSSLKNSYSFKYYWTYTRLARCLDFLVLYTLCIPNYAVRAVDYYCQLIFLSLTRRQTIRQGSYLAHIIFPTHSLKWALLYLPCDYISIISQSSNIHFFSYRCKLQIHYFFLYNSGYNAVPNHFSHV